MASTDITLVAADQPDAPTAVSTVVDGIYVKIAWTAPASDNNKPVQYYQILIETSATGTFVEDQTACDGTDATTITNAYCLVPMTQLWASPFSLVLGDSVNAKVLAYNDRGWSAESTAGAGETVKTEPT